MKDFVQVSLTLLMLRFVVIFYLISNVSKCNNKIIFLGQVTHKYRILKETYKMIIIEIQFLRLNMI